MQSSRRLFLRGLASVAGAASAQTAYAQHVHPAPPPPQGAGTACAAARRRSRRTSLAPVSSRSSPPMSPTCRGGWRTASRCSTSESNTSAPSSIPGRVVDGWGFNGSIPGPTIQVNEGDRVRLNVDNKLPEPFSMHWHGLEIPIEMDGMPGISQDAIPPGGRFIYEFTLKQNGTFFYHSHMAMQEMMGLIGLFIIHPRRAHAPRVDRDFGIVLQEWALLPNNTIPNSLAMEFNWLTMNGKAGPATTPMIVKLGERVRIRLVNLGMDHHPDAHARPSVLRHRHRRRAHPDDGRASGEHGARRRRAGARHRVRRRQPRRLASSLPPAAPHDEPDGVDGRAADDVARQHAAARQRWKPAWAFIEGHALGDAAGAGLWPQRQRRRRDRAQRGQHAAGAMPPHRPAPASRPHRTPACFPAIRRTCSW